MKLLLVTVFSVISPFSVQSAAPPAAHELPWTVMEGQMPEIISANDRSETYGQFETLNGVSLEDQKAELLARMGEPSAIQEDPYLGCDEFNFDDVQVGICEDTGTIQYVHVKGSHDHWSLNGTVIPMQMDAIHQALGQPHYIAEDGEVYLRGQYAIKVYMKPGSGEVEGIDLFDDTAS
ncbi:hypothetical protein [Paenibacillus barcinonensis]|nr:hypothetical protein [Paenibacillus barcinonensis]